MSHTNVNIAYLGKKTQGGGNSKEVDIVSSDESVAIEKTEGNSSVTFDLSVEIPDETTISSNNNSVAVNKSGSNYDLSVTHPTPPSVKSTDNSVSVTKSGSEYDLSVPQFAFQSSDSSVQVSAQKVGDVNTIDFKVDSLALTSQDTSITITDSTTNHQRTIDLSAAPLDITSPMGTMKLVHSTNTNHYELDKRAYADDYEIYDNNNLPYNGSSVVSGNFYFRMSDKVSYQIFTYSLPSSLSLSSFKAMFGRITRFTDELKDNEGTQYEYNSFKRKIVYVKNEIAFNGSGLPMLYRLDGSNFMKRSKTGSSWSDSALTGLVIVNAFGRDYVQIEYGEVIAIELEYVRYPQQTDGHPAIIVRVNRDNMKPVSIPTEFDRIFLGNHQFYEISRTGSSSSITLNRIDSGLGWLPKYELLLKADEAHDVTFTLPDTSTKTVSLLANEPKVVIVRSFENSLYIE